MHTATFIRDTGDGALYHLDPGIGGKPAEHVLVRRLPTGTQVWPATADGRMRTGPYYFTDQSPQDALIDLGYTRSE